MRNFRANIRPDAIIDEGIGRRHRTPGFQHRQPRYQTRFVIGPDLPSAVAGLRGLFARVMAIPAPAVSAIFAKLGGLPFFRFATRALFYMLRVDLF
jgi:hypothetical protein